VALLGGGTAAAQLISISVTPIITRLFTPENFGVLAVFLSITGMVSVISTLAYEKAILIPRSDDDGAALVAVSSLVLCAISSLCLVSAALFGDCVADLMDAPELRGWIYAVPAGVFGTGLFNILRSWQIRSRRFKNTAAASLTNTCTMVGLRIGSGVALGARAGGLIGSKIAASLVAAGVLAWGGIRGESQLLAKMGAVRWARMKATALEYKKFPLYNSWTLLLNTVSHEVIVLLFGVLYTPAVVGFYHLGRRLLQQPSSFLGRAVNDAYLQKAAQQRAQGRALLSGLGKTTLVLAGLGVVPFGVVGIWGSVLFPFVFGENWTEAGLYAQILSPWLFLLLINRPANVVYTVLQKLEWQLNYSVTLFLLRCAAIVGGWVFFDDAVVSLALFSGLSVVFNLGFIGMAFWFAFHAGREGR